MSDSLPISPEEAQLAAGAVWCEYRHDEFGGVYLLRWADGTERRVTVMSARSCTLGPAWRFQQEGRYLREGVFENQAADEKLS